MLSHGVRLDARAVEMMLRASQSPRMGRKAFSILGAPGVEICAQRFVLQCKLRACMRDIERLGMALGAFWLHEPSLAPMCRAYYLLTRAIVALGRTEVCSNVAKSVDAHVVMKLNCLRLGSRPPECALEFFREMEAGPDFDSPDADAYTVIVLCLVHLGLFPPGRRDHSGGLRSLALL